VCVCIQTRRIPMCVPMRHRLCVALSRLLVPPTPIAGPPPRTKKMVVRSAGNFTGSIYNLDDRSTGYYNRKRDAFMYRRCPVVRDLIRTYTCIYIYEYTHRRTSTRGGGGGGFDAIHNFVVVREQKRKHLVECTGKRAY